MTVYQWIDKSKQMERVEYQPSQRVVYRSTSSFLLGMKTQGRANLYKKCCLCGWSQGRVDMAHIIPNAKKGRCSVENIAPLCPNCHRLFDAHQLSEKEKFKLFEWMRENIPREEKNSVGTDKNIKPEHWEVFRYYVQEKKGTLATAELVQRTPTEVKKLLSELRKMHPELFNTEREYLRFTHQNMPRDGHKLSSIDDIDHNEIKQKF